MEFRQIDKNLKNAALCKILKQSAQTIVQKFVFLINGVFLLSLCQFFRTRLSKLRKILNSEIHRIFIMDSAYNFFLVYGPPE